MKYYIKAPKATGLHRATAIPKTKAKPMLSLDQMLQFAFNLTAARSSDNPKHSQGVLHYTLLCKVARIYKTITPKTPQRPPKQYGGFFVPL